MSNNPVFFDNDLERLTYISCFTTAKCAITQLPPELRNAKVEDATIIDKYGEKNIIVTHDKNFYKNKLPNQKLKGVAVLEKSPNVKNVKIYKDKIAKIFKSCYGELNNKVTYIKESSEEVIRL